MLFEQFIEKEVNKDKFFKLSPTLLGVCAGAKLYECPINGDEAPVVLVMDGKAYRTNQYEVDDFADYINEGLKPTNN